MFECVPMHVHVPKLIRRLSKKLSPILIHLASLFLLLQLCFCDVTAILTHLCVLSSRCAVTSENYSFLLMLVDCVQSISKNAYNYSTVFLFHNYRF